MYLFTPENANSTKITVTSTATSLFSLMDTAGGGSTDSLDYYTRPQTQGNVIIIRPEDGDIRFLVKATPTSTVGMLLKSGGMYAIPGMDFSLFNLIRIGAADVAVSVVFGYAEKGEAFSGIADTVSLTLDEFPAATALTDATANPTTTVVGSMTEVFNDTTWDRARGGSTANSATVTGFQNQLPMARYNATPATRTEAQFGNIQADVNGAMNVNVSGGALSMTGIQDGRTVVTTAGTRVVLAASTACKRVTIVAETDNTGVIVVGGTSVVAALVTRQGVPLFAGDTFEMDIDNLNDINIDSTVSTDGVTYTYFT